MAKKTKRTLKSVSKYYDIAFELAGGSEPKSINAYIRDSVICKRNGYKTFKGMVRMLDKVNENYKLAGWKGDIVLRLPVKGRL